MSIIICIETWDSGVVAMYARTTRLHISPDFDQKKATTRENVDHPSRCHDSKPFHV
jgi:hypothetical protein